MYVYDEDEYLERLIICLNLNLPHPLIIALLDLANSDIAVDEAWRVWRDSDYWPPLPYANHWSVADRRTEFAAAVEAVADLTIVTCERCQEWDETDNATTVANGDTVCDPCIADNYSACERCSEWSPSDDMTFADDTDAAYCESCRDNYLSWCEQCEVYWRHDHDSHEDEEDACDCEAPHQRFRFPANGDGTITNDTRLDVTLPAGTIDETGLYQIRQLLYNDLTYDVVEKAMNAVGDLWQAKRGNFTRRLSRELYANHKTKIPEGVLTQIGNLARQHSSDSSEWAVEFTRNLNLSPDAFCHGGSCWWQSYYLSRCALKQWGGLGIRTFDSYGNPEGRAWVQPLNEDMEPTHDTMDAHAYLIYNCYGELSGAQPARIIAHLSSKTYRKVEFESAEQYVNNNNGWLVADEATCRTTDCVTIDAEPHNRFDANDIPTLTNTDTEESAA